MQCDVCKIRPAEVQIRVRINGMSTKLTLCPECMSKIQSGHPVSNGGYPIDGLAQMFGGSGAANGSTFVHGDASPSRGGLLDQVGRNLNDWAKDGRVDPVIGRDDEITRVVEILNRRNKNNPVLIGEPGVGKTAIAEGLALRIFEGQVPAKLKNKQIYSLDVASLVADTGVRGQFEERMKALISELESRDEVILFIDELHLLVGAGSAQGSMDAGNILKPALARGDVQIVGATTLKEYRQIERDAALERRFQPVIVDEPTVEEAIEILRGLQPKYQTYHQVAYSDEAIAACVMLSNRYISDRYLPDKAIDLMDEAGSKANLRATDGTAGKVAARLDEIVREKQEATKHEAYERAAELRKEELELRQQLQLADGERQQTVVDVELIQTIVENKTGIPVRKIQMAEQEKLRDLATELKGHVIGQEQAVDKVSRAVRRSRTGLRKGNRPIGSFLFVGPTGVGKTELAKSLALALFGSKDAMIRFDMSEYMEKHSVAKLIGAPPGYVGYDEAGQLTEKVRRNPYSLILLDEIEKAHPDVQHMFLQIMEDGRLTDSQGRTVSFKDTIIIMTSNAGTGEKRARVGFKSDDATFTESTSDIDLDTLTAHFKPEFLNRFDAVVEFSALTTTDTKYIATLFLKELAETAKASGLTLNWTERAVERLAELGHHPTYGARPLRRVIQSEIEDRMADLLVDNPDCEVVDVDLEDSRIVVLARDHVAQ